MWWRWACKQRNSKTHTLRVLRTHTRTNVLRERHPRRIDNMRTRDVHALVCVLNAREEIKARKYAYYSYMNCICLFAMIFCASWFIETNWPHEWHSNGATRRARSLITTILWDFQSTRAFWPRAACGVVDSNTHSHKHNNTHTTRRVTLVHTKTLSKKRTIRDEANTTF